MSKSPTQRSQVKDLNDSESFGDKNSEVLGSQSFGSPDLGQTKKKKLKKGSQSSQEAEASKEDKTTEEVSELRDSQGSVLVKLRKEETSSQRDREPSIEESGASGVPKNGKEERTKKEYPEPQKDPKKLQKPGQDSQEPSQQLERRGRELEKRDRKSPTSSSQLRPETQSGTSDPPRRKGKGESQMVKEVSSSESESSSSPISRSVTPKEQGREESPPQAYEEPWGDQGPPSPEWNVYVSPERPGGEWWATPYTDFPSALYGKKSRHGTARKQRLCRGVEAKPSTEFARFITRVGITHPKVELTTFGKPSTPKYMGVFWIEKIHRDNDRPKCRYRMFYFDPSLTAAENLDRLRIEDSPYPQYNANRPDKYWPLEHLYCVAYGWEDRIKKKGGRPQEDEGEDRTGRRRPSSRSGNQSGSVRAVGPSSSREPRKEEPREREDRRGAEKRARSPIPKGKYSPRGDGSRSPDKSTRRSPRRRVTPHHQVRHHRDEEEEGETSRSRKRRYSSSSERDRDRNRHHSQESTNKRRRYNPEEGVVQPRTGGGRDEGTTQGLGRAPPREAPRDPTQATTSSSGLGIHLNTQQDVLSFVGGITQFIMEKVKPGSQPESAATVETREAGSSVTTTPASSIRSDISQRGSASKTISIMGRSPIYTEPRRREWEGPQIEEEDTEDGLLASSPSRMDVPSGLKNKFRRFLDFTQPFKEFQEMMITLGIRPTSRVAAAEAATQRILGTTIGGVPRQLAMSVDKESCGKIYISSFQSPALFKTRGPDDIIPEDIAKYLGIRVSLGKLETNEPCPVFDFKSIPSGDALRTAEQRHVTSFFPPVTTHPPRVAIPQDNALFEQETEINKTLDDTFRVISALTAGDSAMALVTATDLAAKLLAKREAIRSKRRLDAENRIAKGLSDTLSPLSGSQSRKLEQNLLATQLLVQSGGASGTSVRTAAEEAKASASESTGNAPAATQQTTKPQAARADPPPPAQESNTRPSGERREPETQHVHITVGGYYPPGWQAPQQMVDTQFFPSQEPPDWRAPQPQFKSYSKKQAKGSGFHPPGSFYGGGKRRQ
jgi:hypothetical protein